MNLSRKSVVRGEGECDICRLSFCMRAGENDYMEKWKMLISSFNERELNFREKQVFPNIRKLKRSNV